MMEELGLNVFTAVLAINSGEAVHGVLTGGPVVSLLVSCLIVTSVPALVAWWVGRHLLKLNPALLMGAVAGARQNTSSMQAAEEMSESAVPGSAIRCRWPSRRSRSRWSRTSLRSSSDVPRGGRRQPMLGMLARN